MSTLNTLCLADKIKLMNMPRTNRSLKHFELAATTVSGILKQRDQLKTQFTICSNPDTIKRNKYCTNEELDTVFSTIGFRRPVTTN